MLIFASLRIARKFPTKGYFASGQMCENSMMDLSTSKKNIYRNYVLVHAVTFDILHLWHVSFLLLLVLCFTHITVR